MSLTPGIKDFYVKQILGMNSKSEELELEGKYVKNAQNLRFEQEPGAVRKRSPLTYYNGTEITDSTGIIGLYRFYTNTLTKFISASEDQIYVGDDAAGTFTSIRTLGTTGNRMAFVVYNNLLIGGNGSDNLFVYDGSSDNLTWELGSCKAKTAGGTGITATSVSYQITIDNDTYICGAVSNTIASLSDQSVSLSFIPLGPIGTADRKIYRKDSGTSGVYKLVDTISDNTTTTYTDTTASASLGATIGSVTDDMPLGDILLIHRERLFISGDSNNPNRIYYANPYLPGFIQQTTNLDYMDIAKDDGDAIIGLKIQLGKLICWKRNTIRPVFVTSAQSGADPATWYAEDPISFKGSPAKWSLCQTPYGVIFLSWDGWYLFDGAQVTQIIREFDHKKILPSLFNDVITYWSKDLFYAAYSDKSIAAQYNNRVMVYNFPEGKFAIDTINANCFSANVGDDESGELYIGDSTQGFVYKAEQAEDIYRLSTKTECNNGTATDVFVGGTESNPYLEIGAPTAPSAIPDNVCIFWDDDVNTPGSGWTEVTAAQGYMPYIDNVNAIANIGGTAGHTHTMSGSFSSSSAGSGNAGDGNNQGTNVNHTHTISGSTSSASARPNHMRYRIFKKNSTTTEYVLPVGSIVMWDHASSPEGWTEVDTVVGFYIACEATTLGTQILSTHIHAYDITSDPFDHTDVSDSGNERSKSGHTHNATGNTPSSDNSDWELDHVKFRFIKKVGEDTTWDGTEQYIYCLYHATSAPGAGWTDVTSTYTGKYIKGHDDSPSTGSRANYSHDHGMVSGETDENLGRWGNGGYHAQCLNHHTHAYAMTSAAADLPNPPSYAFHLVKKILGQMVAYNDAIDNVYTSGNWVSPAIKINAQTLNNLYWNAIKGASDTVTFYTRVGATQAACEAASYSAGLTDGTGSPVASTPNVWFQYKIAFTAADSTVSNPRVYLSSNYLVKLTYQRAGAVAEVSVEFIYETGFINFDEPMVDKIWLKIISYHEATAGSMKIYWETEVTTGSFFLVDITQNPSTFDSFFPDDAIGKKINFKWYKNDLEDLTLKELQGLYQPQPILV